MGGPFLWPSGDPAHTLLETSISPKNCILKMSFLFPRWDTLIPWRVLYFLVKFWKVTGPQIGKHNLPTTILQGQELLNFMGVLPAFRFCSQGLLRESRSVPTFGYGSRSTCPGYQVASYLVGKHNMCDRAFVTAKSLIWIASGFICWWMIWLVD